MLSMNIRYGSDGTDRRINDTDRTARNRRSDADRTIHDALCFVEPQLTATLQRCNTPLGNVLRFSNFNRKRLHHCMNSTAIKS